MTALRVLTTIVSGYNGTMNNTTEHASLLELRVGDSPAAWAGAGFDVAHDAVAFGATIVRLIGPSGHRGIVGWSLEGIDASIDGLRSFQVGKPAESRAAEHPNGVTHIDHVVVETDDFSRTLPALEAAGVELRRTRTFDLADGQRKQCFFWLGPVILELVGRTVASRGAAGPARFWGLALTAPDLETTAAFLGDRTSEPKPAVQKGRQISTLRSRDLDISVPIALMSPHVG